MDSLDYVRDDSKVSYFFGSGFMNRDDRGDSKGNSNVGKGGFKFHGGVVIKLGKLIKFVKLVTLREF